MQLRWISTFCLNWEFYEAGATGSAVCGANLGLLSPLAHFLSVHTALRPWVICLMNQCKASSAFIPPCKFMALGSAPLRVLDKQVRIRKEHLKLVYGFGVLAVWLSIWRPRHSFQTNEIFRNSWRRDGTAKREKKERERK